MFTTIFFILSVSLLANADECTISDFVQFSANSATPDSKMLENASAACRQGLQGAQSNFDKSSEVSSVICSVQACTDIFQPAHFEHLVYPDCTLFGVNMEERMEFVLGWIHGRVQSHCDGKTGTYSHELSASSASATAWEGMTLLGSFAIVLLF